MILYTIPLTEIQMPEIPILLTDARNSDARNSRSSIERQQRWPRIVDTLNNVKLGTPWNEGFLF